MSDRRGPRIPNWLYYTVVLIVTAVWGLAMGLTLFVRGFAMPAELNGVFSFVLVSVLGAKAYADSTRNRQGDDE